MASAPQPAAPNVMQLEELNQQLSRMRHDINNHLSLIMAAVELIRRKPDATERMIPTLTEQPAKITQAMRSFSANFEAACGIQRS